MIYKAVRFPEYVPEYNHASKEDEIKPLFSFMGQPTSGTDYSITGQELLASLCNLYKKINAPDANECITDLVWDWCRNNIHPYDIEELCLEIENGDFMNPYFHEWLQKRATFEVRTFVSDLCKLGTAFEYYDALQKLRYGHNVAAGRNLYYEGRVCDSLPFLEKYSQYTDDAEYLEHFNSDYDDRIFDALEMFPDFKMRVKQIPNLWAFHVLKTLVLVLEEIINFTIYIVLRRFRKVYYTPGLLVLECFFMRTVVLL